MTGGAQQCPRAFKLRRAPSVPSRSHTAPDFETLLDSVYTERAQFEWASIVSIIGWKRIADKRHMQKKRVTVHEMVWNVQYTILFV